MRRFRRLLLSLLVPVAMGYTAPLQAQRASAPVGAAAVPRPVPPLDAAEVADRVAMRAHRASGEGRRGARRGAKIGVLAGAGVGAAAGIAARCGTLKDPIDGDCLSRASAATVGGALGAAAGAVLGAVAGAVLAARRAGT